MKELTNQNGEPTSLVQVDAGENRIVSNKELAAQITQNLDILDKLSDKDFEDKMDVTSKYMEFDKDKPVIAILTGYDKYQKVDEKTGEMVDVFVVCFQTKEGRFVNGSTVFLDACMNGGMDIGDAMRITYTGKSGKTKLFEVKRLSRQDIQSN